MVLRIERVFVLCLARTKLGGVARLRIGAITKHMTFLSLLTWLFGQDRENGDHRARPSVLLWHRRPAESPRQMKLGIPTSNVIWMLTKILRDVGVAAERMRAQDRTRD